MSDKLVFDHYPIPPRSLPKTWAVTSVGEIAKEIASGFPSGKHNQEERGTPHIRPMNISRDGRLDLGVLKYVEGTVPRELSKGDVIFNNTNSPELVGKTAVVRIDERLGYSNHMTRIQLQAGMNPVFVAHQLHFLWISGYFRHRCVNHVNQASISADPLAETVPLLVTSSAEQGRIADAVDEILSDLDEGLVVLERIQGKLHAYRASVLKAAVEGELTAEWRQQHPHVEPASVLLNKILAARRRRWEEEQVRKFDEKGTAPPKNWKQRYKEPAQPNSGEPAPLPDGWCWMTVEQLILEPIVNGISVRGTDEPPGVAALRLNAMSLRGLDFSAKRYLPLKESDVEDLWIRAGDFFVSRANGSMRLVGRGSIAGTPPEPTIFPDTMMRLRLNTLDGLRSSWIPTIWSSNVVRRQIEGATKTTAGILKIAQPDLARICIPVPPTREQEAIVEAVEDQLSVIDHVEAEINAKLTSAQALRHSILRHAFTGQLVPQDPNDEPASELLERISATRDAAPFQKKSAKTR